MSSVSYYSSLIPLLIPSPFYHFRRNLRCDRYLYRISPDPDFNPDNPNPDPYLDPNPDNPDTQRSGTLKMLIKNKNSRKAFYAFIESTQKGKEELLDYFLFIESIKKTNMPDCNPEDSRKRFIEVIAQYERKSKDKGPDSPELIIYNSTHTWKDIKTLPLDELSKHMSRSQDEVLLSITPLFESFLLSSSYKDYNSKEMANERKSYASSLPIE